MTLPLPMVWRELSRGTANTSNSDTLCVTTWVAPMATTLSPSSRTTSTMGVTRRSCAGLSGGAPARSAMSASTPCFTSANHAGEQSGPVSGHDWTMLAAFLALAVAYPTVQLEGFPFVRQKPDFCGEADVE